LLALFGAGFGIGCCSTAAVVGAGVDWTVRLFTTVRIPATWATSFPASERAASFVTLPFSVATPLVTDV
jgi:hypothetical protein